MAAGAKNREKPASSLESNGSLANKTGGVKDLNQCHEKKEVIVRPPLSVSKTYPFSRGSS